MSDDTLLTPVYATPIEHPGAWRVADFTSPTDYTIELGATHLQDIERALRRIKAAGLGLDDLQREHFELPSLQPVIDEIREQIEEGRGFVVVRRLPVEDYSKDEIGTIFWATLQSGGVSPLTSAPTLDQDLSIQRAALKAAGCAVDVHDEPTPELLHWHGRRRDRRALTGGPEDVGPNRRRHR
jgi:hypothetical protein